MDPVVIGRNVFSITNDSVSGILDYIQDMLCAILDWVLDIIKGICSMLIPLYWLELEMYYSINILTCY